MQQLQLIAMQLEQARAANMNDQSLEEQRRVEKEAELGKYRQLGPNQQQQLLQQRQEQLREQQLQQQQLQEQQPQPEQQRELQPKAMAALPRPRLWAAAVASISCKPVIVAKRFQPKPPSAPPPPHLIQASQVFNSSVHFTLLRVGGRDGL